MRVSDLIHISIKNIKGKWAVLVALGMAISAFCLCYAGTAFMTVQQEKSMPFELIASTENTTGITDTMLAEISKIVDVEDATPVITIPVQMNMGEYVAELTLTGVNPSYLENSNLPENSVMPYIVLNEAACKLFSKDKEKTVTTEAPKIDWLNTKAILTIGEESAGITAKVCGILESEKDDEPTAYISINAAKSLLKTSGQTAVYTTAYVRIANIGRAESVNNALGALQLTATNADAELQARWDLWSKEMNYLFVMGAFGLLCSVVLLSAWRRISADEQENAYAMLHWLGMKKKDIARIFALQSTLLSLIGVSIGALITVTLPSFLPQELKSFSVFMLPIPIIIIVAGAALCLGINIPLWFAKKPFIESR